MAFCAYTSSYVNKYTNFNVKIRTLKMSKKNCSMMANIFEYVWLSFINSKQGYENTKKKKNSPIETTEAEIHTQQVE